MCVYVCCFGMHDLRSERRKKGGREGGSAGREEMFKTCNINYSFLTVEEEEEEGWVVRSTGRGVQGGERATAAAAAAAAAAECGVERG